MNHAQAVWTVTGNTARQAQVEQVEDRVVDRRPDHHGERDRGKQKEGLAAAPLHDQRVAWHHEEQAAPFKAKRLQDAFAEIAKGNENPAEDKMAGTARNVGRK